jgi:hypothetical protein
LNELSAYVRARVLECRAALRELALLRVRALLALVLFVVVKLLVHDVARAKLLARALNHTEARVVALILELVRGFLHLVARSGTPAAIVPHAARIEDATVVD